MICIIINQLLKSIIVTLFVRNHLEFLTHYFFNLTGLKCACAQDREKIRNAATQLRDELKQNNYGVGVQLPKEWRESRKSLYPVMQAERRKGNNTRFIGEKLFVNGQEYKSNSTGSG